MSPDAQRAIADERAAQIEPALDRNVGVPSMVCARISPRTICSVKFFDPTRIAALARARGRARRGGQQDQATTTAARTDAIVRRRRRREKLRSASSSVPSTASASTAAGTAPARITVGSTIESPRKMYSPSPPAPTAAAIVAVPTPITAATRMPATIDGSASGSCTCQSICRGVIPSAVPASTSDRIDAADAGDGRPDDRQQRVEDQHDDRDARAEAADERQRQQEAEHRQARDRLHDVARARRSARRARGRRAASTPTGTPIAIARQRRRADEQHVLREQAGEFVTMRGQEGEEVHAQEPAAPGLEQRLQQRTDARVGRLRELARRGDLRDDAVVEHADARRERERFGHVVRDDDDRLAHFAPESGGTRDAAPRA